MSEDSGLATVVTDLRIAVAGLAAGVTQQTAATTDLRAELATLRLELVHVTTYNGDQALLKQRIDGLEGDLREEKERVTAAAAKQQADRRLVYATLIAPVLLMILGIVLKAQGLA